MVIIPLIYILVRIINSGIFDSEKWRDSVEVMMAALLGDETIHQKRKEIYDQ